VTSVYQNPSVYEGRALDEIITVIDPGGSTTGWSVWMLPSNLPIERIDYGLIKDGLFGFIEWALNHHRYLREATVVCEKFVPEGGPEDYTPLQIEGALISALYNLAAPEAVFQLRSRKRNLGVKRVRDDLLKENGLWLPGSDPAIDWTDARDVNDTALHALIYAKDRGHEPTLRRYWAP
jgi:hypothetical protein